MLERLAPAFLLRRVLWYLVVVVIVVRLFGSKVVLNDFNLWFYFAHVYVCRGPVCFRGREGSMFALTLH